MPAGAEERRPDPHVPSADDLSHWFEPVIEGTGGHPLDHHGDRDLVRVTMLDGQVLEGSLCQVANQHFIHLWGAGLPSIGKVEGPLLAGDVASVEIVLTKAERIEQARERSLGPRVAGREPVGREDFEHRLQTLARAIAAAASGPGEIHVQLHRQFEACAARIGLAAGKRAWVLAAARWARTSNEEPTMADLWMDAEASPGFFARPRPQDFDPDPAARRKHVPPPRRCASIPGPCRTCSRP